MEVLQRIQGIIRHAEKALADLTAECMTKRDFDGAARAIATARALSDLLSEDAVDHAAGEATTVPVEPLPPALSTSSAVATRVQRVRKGDYPKFMREGEVLVKIGWSKREKTEYEHKCPKKVLALLLPALMKAGSIGRRFSMDKVLPVRDADGGDVPDYQSYLCLAWLRAVGLVEQHGRQGYSISRSANLQAGADAAWEKLPAR